MLAKARTILDRGNTVREWQRCFVLYSEGDLGLGGVLELGRRSKLSVPTSRKSGSSRSSFHRVALIIENSGRLPDS